MPPNTKRVHGYQNGVIYQIKGITAQNKIQHKGVNKPMKNLKEFKQELQKLRGLDKMHLYVIDDILEDSKEYKGNYIEQIKARCEDVSHGCITGIVSSLCYYTDTVKFYEKFEREINEMLKEIRENIGVPKKFIGSMYDDVAEVMFLNNPDELNKYYLQKRINILFGITPSELTGMMISYGKDNTIIIKALYDNYIVEEMVRRDENILKKPIEAQDSLVQTIVDELKLSIGSTDTTIKFSEEV